MPRLLVEYPDGNQQIVEITDTGSFFDSTKVLWDERKQGALPADIELGKMAKQENALVKLPDYKPEYKELLQDRTEEFIKEQSLILWQAADAYINAEINGVGLSILAAGVYAQKPKAIAVAQWCDSIWTEYYIRKSKIAPALKVNTDFSMLGAMPFTVLELREEVSDLWITKG